MSEYRLRVATTADQDVLVHQRVAMFQDMGIEFDAQAVGEEYREWLLSQLAAGAYRAWVVEDASRAVVAGGGLSILPWPPGPRYPGGRVAFVYNVYTEPGHRQRGLARRLMDAVHAFCRDEGITNVVLNASQFGKPLYESMGYSVTTSPMMFLSLP
jgi:GNAT superfamily N-acetyltransferase